MSMSPPDLYTPPTEGEAGSTPDSASWQQIEAELKRAQSAMQQPLLDTFVRLSDPQRQRTVLDLKVPPQDADW